MKRFLNNMEETFMSEGAGSANGVETVIKLGIVGAMGIAMFGIARFAMDSANKVKDGVSAGSAILDDGGASAPPAAGWF